MNLASMNGSPWSADGIEKLCRSCKVGNFMHSNPHAAPELYVRGSLQRCALPSFVHASSPGRGHTPAFDAAIYRVHHILHPILDGTDTLPEGGRRITLDNSRVYVRFLPFVSGRGHPVRPEHTEF